MDNINLHRIRRSSTLNFTCTHLIVLLPNDLVIGHFTLHSATGSCGAGGNKVVLPTQIDERVHFLNKWLYYIF